MDRFGDQVLDIVKEIPAGSVATYAQIAKLTKNPKAFQAVGQALRNNSTPITIPCHRVVKSDGALGGYAAGVKKKIELLKKEGVKIRDGKVDLKSYGWRRS